MTTLKFRSASILDIPAMLEIRFSVRENKLSNPNRVTTQFIEEYLDFLFDDRPYELRGWVCEFNGKVVGYCYAETGNASIWALFVSPIYEGKGIGKALLNLAVNWLFNLGKKQVRLSTQANTRADRFYSAQGWIKRGMKNDTEVWYCLPNQAKQSKAANHELIA